MALLKGKEDDFYHLLKTSASLVHESSAYLLAAVSSSTNVEDQMNGVIEIEHKADEVTKAIIIKLHKTLVTPIDREDIYQLANDLDDVVDFVQGGLERMIMYKATNPIPGVVELIRLLNECTKLIESSIIDLSDIKGKMKAILDNMEHIRSLESMGDRLYRLEVAKLFAEETNAIEVIKWKEILEHFEDALDKCEDLSNAIKGVVLKYA